MVKNVHLESKLPLKYLHFLIENRYTSVSVPEVFAHGHGLRKGFLPCRPISLGILSKALKIENLFPCYLKMTSRLIPLSIKNQNLRTWPCI